MKIYRDAHDHYTEEDGGTTHSLLEISKNDRISIRDLITIARAVGAATTSRSYYEDRYIQKGCSSPGYLHEEEIFFVIIKGKEGCEYTLRELYQALGRESTTYPSP